MNRPYWVRVREQIQAAQVIVCVQALGEAGFLRAEALEFEPAFIAESLVKGVDIDGCVTERDEVREVVQASLPKTPDRSPATVLPLVLIEPVAPKCDACGEIMVLRRGKFGEFYSCPNWADGCRGKTVSLKA
jgi:hypothetical protein